MSSNGTLITIDPINGHITDGDTFGIKGLYGPQVWQLVNGKAARLGGGSAGPDTEVVLQHGESLTSALQRITTFEGQTLTIYRMSLGPGEYHHRISRPNSHFFSDDTFLSPDQARWQVEERNTLFQLRSIIDSLNQVFRSVHPDPANMTVYGTDIRSILLMAATECEAQWKGILKANNASSTRNTTDYVKLCPALKLQSYSVSLPQFPSLQMSSPFANWNDQAPSASIPWYDAYNKTKHDREANFSMANLQNAVDAICAVWISIIAQFGIPTAESSMGLTSFFKVDRKPSWNHFEFYTPYPTTSAVDFGF